MPNIEAELMYRYILALGQKNKYLCSGMKNNPSLKGFIIAFVAVLLSFGIYFFFLEKADQYLVDNPTDSTFYFVLNRKEERVIASDQFVKVDLKKGRNFIKILDGRKKLLLDTSFVVTKNRGLINIALQDYYINRQFYGNIRNKDSILVLNKVDIDGEIYYGDIKKSSAVYTEDFYFNINHDYDAVVKEIQKHESRTKIFRKNDFIKYYKEYYKF